MGALTSGTWCRRMSSSTAQQAQPGPYDANGTLSLGGAGDAGGTAAAGGAGGTGPDTGHVLNQKPLDPVDETASSERAGNEDEDGAGSARSASVGSGGGQGQALDFGASLRPGSAPLRPCTAPAAASGAARVAAGLRDGPDEASVSHLRASIAAFASPRLVGDVSMPLHIPAAGEAWEHGAAAPHEPLVLVPPQEELGDRESEVEDDGEEAGVWRAGGRGEATMAGDVLHVVMDAKEGLLEFWVNGVPGRRIRDSRLRDARLDEGGDGGEGGEGGGGTWLAVSLCGVGDQVSLYPSTLAATNPSNEPASAAPPIPDAEPPPRPAHAMHADLDSATPEDGERDGTNTLGLSMLEEAAALQRDFPPMGRHLLGGGGAAALPAGKPSRVGAWGLTQGCQVCVPACCLSRSHLVCTHDRRLLRPCALLSSGFPFMSHTYAPVGYESFPSCLSGPPPSAHPPSVPPCAARMLPTESEHCGAIVQCSYAYALVELRRLSVVNMHAGVGEVGGDGTGGGRESSEHRSGVLQCHQRLCRHCRHPQLGGPRDFRRRCRRLARGRG